MVTGWREKRVYTLAKLFVFVTGINATDNNCFSDDEVRLGIFLPPLQHLLLKFRPLNQTTVVSVATDDWRLLQVVESYLLQFELVSG